MPPETKLYPQGGPLEEPPGVQLGFWWHILTLIMNAKQGMVLVLTLPLFKWFSRGLKYIVFITTFWHNIHPDNFNIYGEFFFKVSAF